MNPIVEILDDTRCELGEGPFYCERRDTLFWFDIVGKKRHSYNFLSHKKTIEQLPEMASAMAVVDDKHDLIFTESGLWLYGIEKSTWSPIASIEADNDVTRSNDARVHSSGAFWLGTMGRNAEPKAGAIYHFRKGVVTNLFNDITIPNAICFSPDGATAYFTDTVTAKLMCVPIDPKTGLPNGEPTVLLDHTGELGGLDGAIVDGDGNIWIALWGASKINCYSPKAKLLRSVELPATQPTCAAFVGHRKIAVTTAWQGMDDAAKEAEKNAGKTFLIDLQVTPKYEPRILI